MRTGGWPPPPPRLRICPQLLVSFIDAFPNFGQLKIMKKFPIIPLLPEGSIYHFDTHNTWAISEYYEKITLLTETLIIEFITHLGRLKITKKFPIIPLLLKSLKILYFWYPLGQLEDYEKVYLFMFDGTKLIKFASGFLIFDAFLGDLKTRKSMPADLICFT